MMQPFLKKTVDFFKGDPERKNYSESFLDHLNAQARSLHIPGGVISLFAWLGFAFDTDPKLHPEFPELFYIRIGLTVAGLLLLLACVFRVRGRGLGLIYLVYGYAFFSCAIFTGRLAADANYVAGLQILIMLGVLIPLRRRSIYIIYIISILLFAGSAAYFKPVLSSDSAKYSMNNLVISYALGLIMAFFLDRFRYDIFIKNIKVEEKSQEVVLQMNRVQELKTRQDGDYFLTSLLIKPLSGDFSSSEKTSVAFLVRQKKRFQFQKWDSEIGGDLCIAYSIKLHGLPYTVFFNGDAMGKSIQGAGGALVLGTVFKSIVTRTQQSPRESSRFPEQWLKECFIELQNVFVSFDGSMLASAVIGLVDDENGFLYYINAEHPWPVLYRKGKASFLGVDESLRKIGIEGLEGRLRISTLKLEEQDVIITGSDGKDDIVIGEDAEGQRIINEDETIFLSLVEQHRGMLDGIEKALTARGELTDDLSLLRIGYCEDIIAPAPDLSNGGRGQLITEGKKALRENRTDEAISYFEKALEAGHRDANLLRYLSKHYLKMKNFEKAASYSESYCEIRPESEDFLFASSYAFKHLGDFARAADFGERLRLRNPSNARNLANLADIHRLSGNTKRAEMIAIEALSVDPDNILAAKITERIRGEKI